MKKRGMVLLLGLVIILGGWWMMRGGSLAQSGQGGLQVWVTWAGEPGPLQAVLDRYSQESGVPVKVRTGVKGSKVLKAMSGSAPPDIVVLSSGDAVGSWYEQGLVEPLDPWIEGTGIDLGDFYPAPLAQCATPEGGYLCLPWGCDLYALFWNKELFEAAGLDPERPPQTMEELAEYGRALTVRDEEGELVQMGFIPDLGRSHLELYARMLGGSWYGGDEAALRVNAQPAIDAADWERQFYRYGAQEVKEFVLSFDRSMNSQHPVYAGKRLSCQQCHRNTPPKNKIPDAGFYEGRVAMVVGSEWLVGPNGIPRFGPELNYGVAPLPAAADHPERANTAVVEGAVAVLPAGVQDKEAAANLLAWMMSPQVVAEVAYAHSSLPASRTAAQDPRFQQIPHFEVFMDLLAQPNAQPVVSTPIRVELNQALGQAEAGWLHQGGDPASLLNEAQAELARRGF